MEEVVALVAVVGLFVSIIILLNLYFRTRHTERLALIKYGREASVFSEDKNTSKKVLKRAFFLMSIGAGLLIGGIVDRIFHFEPIGVLSCMALFGGYGLYFYYHHVGAQDTHAADMYKNEEDEMI